ncbi:MAG TPA: hypothetical protein VIA45_03385 [Thermoanaerobaculia bacterium]|jgi:hypothetical protein
MTVLSCLAIGLAFGLAVVLLTFAGVLLGLVVPRWIERLRGRGRSPSGGRGPSPD